MATILEFTGRHVAPERENETEVSSGATAEIIFFPGIRIERYDIDPFLDDEVEMAVEDAVKSSKG